jgi:hypothetical protein
MFGIAQKKQNDRNSLTEAKKKKKQLDDMISPWRMALLVNLPLEHDKRETVTTRKKKNLSVEFLEFELTLEGAQVRGQTR